MNKNTSSDTFKFHPSKYSTSSTAVRARTNEEFSIASRQRVCVCVSVRPLLETMLSMTDLAEAVTLRFGSSMFTLTKWPSVAGTVM